MNEFVIKLAVSTLVTILASTIKNPKSENARKLRKYVLQVHDASHQFLIETAQPGDEPVQ